MFPAGAQAGRLQEDRCDGDGDSGRRTIAAMDNATRSAAMGSLMAVISGETAEVVTRAGDELLATEVPSLGSSGKQLDQVPRARCRVGEKKIL
jgi:hypothetical protein